MVSRVMEHSDGLGWWPLLVLVLGRLIFNAAFRIVYPLLAFLANGFGVSLETVSLLVTIQVAATLISPIGGMVSDARGERFTLLLGMAIYGLGTLLCALTDQFGLFLVGYSLIGLATALYMPAVQSYASARSNYAQRARVLGILELSWALAALLGVAGLTALIEVNNDWTPAYWVLFGLGLVMMALSLTLPGDPPRVPRNAQEPQMRLATLLRRPEIFAALALVFCQLAAVELIFVVYAGWLEQDFGASTQQLGQIFGLLGIVELLGASAATLLTDRIGKRRAVLFGFAAVALSMLLLPFSSGNWALFLLFFLLFDLVFEFSIVSAFPLMSGLTHQGRGTVLAATVGVIGLGRILGSVVGPRLFVAYGFGANAWLAAGLAVIGVVIGVLLVREGDA
ncbi:MAG: MFS transporter [Oscillochloris sp.]|nr:MFS transporter [Oscillochloris sp.]